MKNMKKILHVSVFKKMSPGQSRQLTYEYECTKTISFWRTVAIVDELSGCDFEVQTPGYLRGFFGRKLYSWWWIKRNIGEDVLLWRYTVDPFVFFFGWLVNPFYSVHHAIDEHELGMIKRRLVRRCLTNLNYLVQKVLRYQLTGRIGVTEEISAHYRALDHRKEKSCLIMHNGISYDRYHVCHDERDPQVVNVVFVASSFSDWHGLDRLLANIDLQQPSSDWVLHIVGLVYPKELELITKLQNNGHQIVIHGVISNEAVMRTLLSKIDVGLSSFALDRKKMRQASTLKVREYLASGIPVFSGHSDSAFNLIELDCYKEGPADIAEILKFGNEAKKKSRSDVRESVRDMIEKSQIMIRVAQAVTSNE